MSAQMNLLDSLESVAPTPSVSGQQHRAVLIALLNEGARGLGAEEAAQRCGLRASHIAATRLIEMSVDGDRDRFPVPLVARSEKKDRPTASGRNAYRWFLTDQGRRVASELNREAA